MRRSGDRGACFFQAVFLDRRKFVRRQFRSDVGHFENVYCRTFAERQARAIFRAVRVFRKSVGHHRSGDLRKHYPRFSFVWKHRQSVGDGGAFGDGAPWHFLFAEGKAAGASRAGGLTEDFMGACSLAASRRLNGCFIECKRENL